MENAEGRRTRGNAECSLRSPESEVSGGHPQHCRTQDVRVQCSARGCAGHKDFGVTGGEKPRGEKGCPEIPS